MPKKEKHIWNFGMLAKKKSTPRVRQQWDFDKQSFNKFVEMRKDKKFVVALSGGKLKLACHLPLLRLMEVLNVKVDELWGVSAGAVMGGLWASGMRVKDIDAVLDDVNLTLMFDFFNLRAAKLALNARKNEQPLRAAGIFPGLKVENYLRELLTKNTKKNPLIKIQDFHAVAYNISQFHRTVFNITKDGRIRHQNFIKNELAGESFSDGDLADIIRASMSMAGIYWPEEIGDDFFLDGGLTEQLPIRSPFITWLDDVKQGKEKRDLFLLGIELVYTTPEAPPPANPLSLIAESFEILGDELARDHEYYIRNFHNAKSPKVHLHVIRPEVPYTPMTEVPDFASQIDTAKKAIIKELADL